VDKKTILNVLGLIQVLCAGGITILLLWLVLCWEVKYLSATEPDTKRYSVTVYSGGKAVEFWIVESKPEVSVSNSVVWADGRTIVGGPVVIQPYKQRPPY
jgi:hypothetical protein